MEGDIKPVVIDTGSGTTKVGFAGNDGPTASFPTVVGYPRVEGHFFDLKLCDMYTGHDAYSKKGVLRLKRPVEKGIITDYGDVEKVRNKLFCYSRVPNRRGT